MHGVLSCLVSWVQLFDHHIEDQCWPQKSCAALLPFFRLRVYAAFESTQEIIIAHECRR